MPPILRIATRESRLALWQAEHVRALLMRRFGQHGIEVELLGMTTRGDQILDRSLAKVGGKGLFVKELETAIEEGRAQLAVHSLKDVPMSLPEGFELAAVLEREDPRDAFVSPRFGSMAELPHGAVVGTSSLRRVVQLLALRPDLRVLPLRGNLDTRLRRLDEGGFDAIVLAAAGLMRLGLAHRIAARFEPAEMLPCAGQGALGLEIRSDAIELKARLAALGHRPTWLAVQAERAVSRALGGNCSMPLAAYAHWQGHQQLDQQGNKPGHQPADRLVLNAAFGHPSRLNVPLLHASGEAAVTTDAEAEALGMTVAQALYEAGAATYLAALPDDASLPLADGLPTSSSDGRTTP